MPVNDPLILKSIQDIVDQIELGKVIPILGYDLFMEGLAGQNQDDFLKRLIKIHAGNEMQSLDPKNNLSGYELINSYYHSLPDTDTFKLRLSRTIQNERFNLNLIPESFRKLVDIKHFKLFVNATFTNSLELALNTYRAKGNNMEEIRSSYQVYKYHPTEPTDLPEEAPNPKFQMNFIDPVIYNLFGTHDDRGGDFVLTDADYIELIYDLILNKNEKFTKILSYLRQGYLLFLGCNFPDWFFRFFIRVCVGNRLDYVSPIKRKSVIDSLADPSRSVFIGLYKIHTLNVNCNELVDEIYQRLQGGPGMPGSDDGGNNSVFISYCRADVKVAQDIASQFDEKYIDYFLDKNNLRIGDLLDQKITTAIDKSCLFIPVVSNNINGATDYIWKEWKYAIDTKKEILPAFKQFVNPDMLLPDEFQATPELRNKILNKNTVLGIIPEGENNTLPEAALKDIKNKQYLARVSGNKQSPL